MSTINDLSPNNRSDLYLDFSQFQGMRKLANEDKEAGLLAAAQQMEGVFLNMMLQSMREANQVFAEGGMFDSNESQFYQEMYDKQLASDMSKQGGIGLADIIVKQMSKNTENKEQQKSFNIEQYLANPIFRFQSDKIKADESDSKNHLQNSNPITRQNIRQDIDSIHLDMWQTPEAFIRDIYPHAVQAANQLNIDPKAILAQAALETGWGKHVMKASDNQSSSFNFFGIKANYGWDGDITRKNTLEYRNGIAAKEIAPFRSYVSIKEAFSDFVGFLKNNARYESLTEKKTEAKQWGYELQKAGYATDPEYGNKIAKIMDSDILQSAIHSTELNRE